MSVESRPYVVSISVQHSLAKIHRRLRVSLNKKLEVSTRRSIGVFVQCLS